MAKTSKAPQAAKTARAPLAATKTVQKPVATPAETKTTKPAIKTTASKATTKTTPEKETTQATPVVTKTAAPPVLEKEKEKPKAPPKMVTLKPGSLNHQDSIKLTPSASTPINLSNATIRLERKGDEAGALALTGAPVPATDDKPRATDILRKGVESIPELCFVGEDKGTIVGVLRFWPVLIGPITTALLLGPLAVHPGWHSRGLAAQLINLGLGRARDLGHKIVLVIGDPSYYSRFGFSRLVTQSLFMPTQVELEKFLGIELVPGAMQGVNGEVRSITAMPPGATSPSAVKLSEF